MTEPEQTTEVVDAEVIADTPADRPAPPTTAVGAELAPRQRRSEVIRPLDTDALIDSFRAYQEMLPRLLDESDYQVFGRNRDGTPKRFPKKSAWRKIGTAFDLDVQIIRSEVERGPEGQPVRAEVWARAIAPSGRFMDGDGYCAIEEERFARSDGRKKLENDLRATATTRAMNRAISGLVGMGEVSAEEMDAGSRDSSEPAEASPELKQAVRAVLTYLLDGETRTVSNTLDAINDHFDSRLPADAGQAICIVAKAVKDHRSPKPAVPIDTSDPQP
jgi:hypothetical protein